MLVIKDILKEDILKNVGNQRIEFEDILKNAGNQTVASSHWLP